MISLKNLTKWLGLNRKQDPFVVNLLMQARWGVQGSRALTSYLAAPNKDSVLHMRRIESNADEVRREMIIRLNHTFVTPIDREDLFGLSRALDNVLDYMYSTTREMHVLQVEPNRYIKLMAKILSRGSQELYLAIQNLEQEPLKADRHAIRVRTLENHMDTLYVHALAELFNDRTKRSPDDVVRMIKLREIYRQMYQAIASAEQAANLISDVIVKFY